MLHCVVFLVDESGMGEKYVKEVFVTNLRTIVAQTVDRFTNRRPLDLGLIFFSDFRPGLDPVFRVFSQLFMCHFINNEGCFC